MAPHAQGEPQPGEQRLRLASRIEARPHQLARSPRLQSWQEASAMRRRAAVRRRCLAEPATAVQTAQLQAQPRRQERRLVAQSSPRRAPRARTA